MRALQSGIENPVRRLSDSFRGGVIDFGDDPLISANPTGKAVLGVAPGAETDPFSVFGGPGIYVMRVPALVRGLRLKLWGGRGMARESGTPAEPGFVQADLRVTPGELLVAIIGLDGTEVYTPSLVKRNLRALGGPGVYLPDNFDVSVGACGGGFSAVYRPSETAIAANNLQAPANSAVFERYLLLDRVTALLTASKLLLLAAGSGGRGRINNTSGINHTAGGRGGFPNGQAGASFNGGGGGSQSAGGAAGDGSSRIGASGSALQGAPNLVGNAGGGGGGLFGGGSGGSYSATSNSGDGAGGGGSSYFDPALAFRTVAPSFGQPANDADAPPIANTRARGRLVALWDPV